jgi:hypothetical protein
LKQKRTLYKQAVFRSANIQSHLATLGLSLNTHAIWQTYCLARKTPSPSLRSWKHPIKQHMLTFCITDIFNTLPLQYHLASLTVPECNLPVPLPNFEANKGEMFIFYETLMVIMNKIPHINHQQNCKVYSFSAHIS